MAVLVLTPVLVRAALNLGIAEAQRVFLPCVFRATLILRVAFAELVGFVVVTWAALVAAVALAEFRVCFPGIVIWSLGAALFVGLAWATHVSGVRLTITALLLRVANAGIVEGPGLARAAEIVRLDAESVLAESLIRAAFLCWIARSTFLRVVSPGLARAAVDITVALAMSWVGDEGVSCTAII